MTIATITTIDRTIIIVTTMTMIGTMTIVVTITATTITTPAPTDGSQEATKGSPDNMSTGCKMCARIDGDHQKNNYHRRPRQARANPARP